MSEQLGVNLAVQFLKSSSITPAIGFGLPRLRSRPAGSPSRLAMPKRRLFSSASSCSMTASCCAGRQKARRAAGTPESGPMTERLQRDRKEFLRSPRSSRGFMSTFNVNNGREKDMNSRCKRV